MADHSELCSHRRPFRVRVSIARLPRLDCVGATRHVAVSRGVGVRAVFESLRVTPMDAAAIATFGRVLAVPVGTASLTALE